ncbi:glycosyltransferase [Sinomonas albida]|uniref:glycosyltransferase n=1 Tax=Sinomonas albida TaxID=369942 RepID=UPI0010A80834|nr:glycosyltransferase [Sinomonas albida]
MAGLIVHEWISSIGGSENVVEAMADVFPNADIYCLWNDAPDRFPERTVHESWLSRTPLRRSKVASLPLMPPTWSSLDVSERDFLLISSHLFAHHAGAAQRSELTPRYVYVHTPARYIWAPELDARGRNPLVKAVTPLLRKLDSRRAASGASFAANSDYVRARIQRCWDQDATVIYPPVDVDHLRSSIEWSNRLGLNEELLLDGLPEDFILGASRFVAYKRLEIAIQAGEATGLPVVLAGAGPERSTLEDLAKRVHVPVHFVDRPSDALLYSLYQRAAVYIFPSTEDFGIMPVEAMALGTPVVAYAEGGARESVELLCGGTVIEEFSDQELATAIDKCLGLDMSSVPEKASQHFGRKAFERRVRSWMVDVIDDTE